MESRGHADPWNQSQKDIDPWDSNWRKKHEKSLLNGKNLEFDTIERPRKNAAAAAGHQQKAQSFQARNHAKQTHKADVFVGDTLKGHIPTIVAVVLFCIMFLGSFLESIFDAIYFSYPVYLLYWFTDNLIPMVIFVIVAKIVLRKIYEHNH